MYLELRRRVVQVLLHIRNFFRSLYCLLEKARLVPNFDEDTVFLLTIAVVAVVLIDSDARAFAEAVRSHSSKVTLIVLLGMAFSVYTAFFSSFKNEIQKFYMLWFAISINFLCAIAGIIFLTDSSASMWLYIFPYLNVVFGILLIIFWHLDILDTSAISGKSSSYSNSVYGTFFILAFVFVGEYLLSIPWPALLSLSVAYASAFNKFAGWFLPRLFSSKDGLIESVSLLVEKSIRRQAELVSEGRFGVVSISTVDTEEDIQIPEKLLSNSDEFIKGLTQIRKPGFSVASVGTYTVQKYWFLPSRENLAIIADVYPEGSKGGYQFCQMFVYTGIGDLELYKGLVYLKRINTNHD